MILLEYVEKLVYKFAYLKNYTYFCSTIKTNKTMKDKHIYYLFMLACSIMAAYGISCEDDYAILFGILGTIVNGIHYLAEKIEELKK